MKQLGASLKPSKASRPGSDHITLHLSLDPTVIHKAKIRASEKGVTLSSVVQDLLAGWTRQ